MKRSSKNIPPKTVVDYLKALPPNVRASLEKVRKAIKLAAPKAEEVISYQIPAYKLGSMVVAIAAFKNHCSLFPLTGNIRKSLGNELKKYKTPGSTLRFGFDDPLPAALVKKIVKLRIRENELRTTKKKTTKNKTTKNKTTKNKTSKK